MTRPIRLIAHRVFHDNAPLAPFWPATGPRCEGVELDIRCAPDGEAWVYHAPVFNLRGSARKRVPKPLRVVMRYLAEHAPWIGLVLLDIKSVEAAEAVARELKQTPPPFEVVLNCWHPEEARALRRRLPQTRILFSVAPIFSRRAPRRLRDLYVHNCFPFITPRRKFTPKATKENRHNINVKLISPSNLSAFLPREIDGLCVHRFFCSDELSDFAGARELQIAVYGLSRSRPERLAALGGVADYAIVSDAAPARRSETTRSLDRAM